MATKTDQAVALREAGLPYECIADRLGSTSGTLRVLVWRRLNKGKPKPISSPWQPRNPLRARKQRAVKELQMLKALQLIEPDHA